MTVHLVIPGLLGPLPETDIPGKLASFPLLKRCLARADQSPWTMDSQRTLFNLLNIGAEGDKDLPVAAISLLGETGDIPEGWWIHADPVTLKADGDRLLLFDAQGLDIQREEMEALATAFNDHFGCDGLRLYTVAPDRWYITATTAPDVQTSLLTDVVGRNIDPWLPQGQEASRWRQIINEVQMLFFNHPVNAAREAIGQPTIGGLWFGGGGALPAPGETKVARICGENALVKGLAALTGIPRATLEDCLVDGEADSVVLVTDVQRTVLDTDPVAWEKQLATVDQLLATLMHNGVAFCLYPGGDYAYRWQSGFRWRFWRTLPTRL